MLHKQGCRRNIDFLNCASGLATASQAVFVAVLKRLPSFRKYSGARVQRAVVRCVIAWNLYSNGPQLDT